MSVSWDIMFRAVMTSCSLAVGLAPCAVVWGAFAPPRQQDPLEGRPPLPVISAIRTFYSFFRTFIESNRHPHITDPRAVLLRTLSDDVLATIAAAIEDIDGT